MNIVLMLDGLKVLFINERQKKRVEFFLISFNREIDKVPIISRTFERSVSSSCKKETPTHPTPTTGNIQSQLMRMWEMWKKRQILN